MPERLGSHALTLGLELENALPVETQGFSSDVIIRASELKVLAGPSKTGSVFVPFTVMFDRTQVSTRLVGRYGEFCRAFHLGCERLKEGDSRRRIMTEYGTIFSLHERCGDPFTLAQRAKTEIEQDRELISPL